MEKKAVIPWSLILFAILAGLKYTVASAMPWWLVLAPLWLPIAFLVVVLIVLGVTAFILTFLE